MKPLLRRAAIPCQIRRQHTHSPSTRGDHNLEFPSKSDVKQNTFSLRHIPSAMSNLPQKKDCTFPMPNPVSLK